jgi:fatty acid desaturase
MTAIGSFTVLMDFRFGGVLPLLPPLLLLGLCLVYLLWSDHFKSKWYTMLERRKWERYNGSKPRSRKP